MLAIQVSIGALNDAVDMPADAVGKPWKPLVTGLVAREVAVAVAAGGAIAGVLLSAGSGIGAGLAGVAAVAIGWAYDLRLARTAFSWLPLALALPVVPIHAWLGATDAVPPGLVALVPVAVLAGAGLALANGLVDVERDAGARRFGAVVGLGPGRGWLAQTALLGVAAALAVVVAPAVIVPGSGSGGDRASLLRALQVGGVVLGVGLLAGGAALLRARTPATRERGWELEALAVACLGVAWLAGIAASAQGGGVAA